jgi:hypothetical protein
MDSQMILVCDTARKIERLATFTKGKFEALPPLA